MCYQDVMVIKGRLRARAAAVAAALVVAPGLVACGEDEEGSTQTTAPAETGAGETPTSTAEAAEVDDGAGAENTEPTGEPLDDDAEITKTLEGVLAGSDPAAACGELVTDRFLRRSYGDASGCEAALKSAEAADNAGVEDVVVLPDSVAQAHARPDGGIYDRQELRAELVLDGETWKLDSLRSNVPVGP